MCKNLLICSNIRRVIKVVILLYQLIYIDSAFSFKIEICWVWGVIKNRDLFLLIPYNSL